MSRIAYQKSVMIEHMLERYTHDCSDCALLACFVLHSHALLSNLAQIARDLLKYLGCGSSKLSNGSKEVERWFQTTNATTSPTTRTTTSTCSTRSTITASSSGTSSSKTADKPAESSLASSLLEKWVWGLMSLPVVQHLAQAGVNDGFQQPLLRHHVSMILGPTQKFFGEVGWCEATMLDNEILNVHHKSFTKYIKLQLIFITSQCLCHFFNGSWAPIVAHW